MTTLTAAQLSTLASELINDPAHVGYATPLNAGNDVGGRA